MASSETAGAQDHGEGENYFVSMTDMMVGMLFIFIIMLMSFALAFRQQTDVTKAREDGQVAHAKIIEEKLDAIQKTVSWQVDQIRQNALARDKLLGEIEAQLRHENLKVVVDLSNGVLHLTDDAIRFPQRAPNLDEEARRNVGKIARVLERVLPPYVPCHRNGSRVVCQNKINASIETIFIEGHTDTTGPDNINWDLSAQRAANTYREITIVSSELRQLLNREKHEILSISGYSSTRPRDDNPADWDKNRRIDLRFVMDTNVAADFERIQTLIRDMGATIKELKESP